MQERKGFRASLLILLCNTDDVMMTQRSIGPQIEHSKNLRLVLKDLKLITEQSLFRARELKILGKDCVEKRKIVRVGFGCQTPTRLKSIQKDRIARSHLTNRNYFLPTEKKKKF